jgi:hypothetical protein
VAAEAFADVVEPGAVPLLGDEENTLLAADGSCTVYGDGGAGKTTLTLDCTLHLTTGREWLGLKVARPLKVLIVENDGPRGRFRRKVRRKLAGWEGDHPGDRLVVLKSPWGETSLANPQHRQALAEYMREVLPITQPSKVKTATRRQPAISRARRSILVSMCRSRRMSPMPGRRSPTPVFLTTRTVSSSRTNGGYFRRSRSPMACATILKPTRIDSVCTVI